MPLCADSCARVAAYPPVREVQPICRPDVSWRAGVVRRARRRRAIGTASRRARSARDSVSAARDSRSTGPSIARDERAAGMSSHGSRAANVNSLVRGDESSGSPFEYSGSLRRVAPIQPDGRSLDHPRERGPPCSSRVNVDTTSITNGRRPRRAAVPARRGLEACEGFWAGVSRCRSFRRQPLVAGDSRRLAGGRDRSSVGYIMWGRTGRRVAPRPKAAPNSRRGTPP